MIVVALLLSVLVGVSLGVLGGGGSILTIPIMKYVLGLDAHQAVAASLFVVGTTSLSALIPHARRGRVRFRTGIIFGLAGMAGAFVSGRLAKYVPAGILLVAFAVMMIVTAIAMLRGRRTKASAGPAAELSVIKLLAQGLVVGAITGLVGAGGGFVVVPALVLLGGLPMSAAVGTSLLVITMNSFAGFAGYVTTTTMDWKLLLAVTFAAILGSFAGAYGARRVDQAKLRRVFGWFVVVMAVYMLAQELPPLLGLELAAYWPWVLAALATVAVTVIPRLVRRRLAEGEPLVHSLSR